LRQKSQIVTREKLRKALWYKKGSSKMLMKLTPAVLELQEVLFATKNFNF